MFLTQKEEQKENFILIFKLKFFIPETGEWVILKVSTNALRTINKNGIASVLSKAIENGNVLV